MDNLKKLFRTILKYVDFINNIGGIAKIFTVPILGAVAVVLSLIFNAPLYVYITIIVIVLIIYISKIILGYLAFKKWQIIGVDEEKRISCILLSLLDIHNYFKGMVSKVIEENINNIDDSLEEIQNAWGIKLSEKDINSIIKNGEKGILKYANKKSSKLTKNDSETMMNVQGIDDTFKNSMYAMTEKDDSYKQLYNILMNQRINLVISNEKISETIDETIEWSRSVFGGVAWQYTYMLGSNDSYFVRTKIKKTERKIEPYFNKRLEKVRKAIRANIMKGV